MKDKVVLNLLQENDCPDTLKQDGQTKLNIKILFLHDDIKTCYIKKSLYYQGILTHYWLFMKGVIYNYQECSGKGLFTYRFAKYHFEKTKKKYIHININDTEYIIKTFGYKLILTDAKKMKRIESSKRILFPPCQIIRGYRNLLKKYLNMTFKYMMFPNLSSYELRVEYYREKGGEELKRFINEYKMKYEEIIKRYILETDETIYQKIVK